MIVWKPDVLLQTFGMSKFYMPLFLAQQDMTEFNDTERLMADRTSERNGRE